MNTTPDETAKDETKEPIEYTNIVERFREVFQKLGIKKSEAYVDHCAKGDLEDLEDIEKKLFEMGLHPALRNQVVNFWASEIKRPVPKTLQKRLAEERGAKPREENGGKEEAEKYSVDTDTGAIKVASTTDKRALTWDEAEKLAKEIKKDIEARGRSEKEPAFVLGEQGSWTLNPKGKIGFGEFAVFQMYQDSLRRGEPIDPVEELTKREEQSVRLREAMGFKPGGEDTEMTTLDKLDKLGMLKKNEGEGGLLAQLDSLGLLKKSGDEGRSTQLDMLDKLNQLGLLKKTGEEGSTTQLDMLDKLNQLGLLKKTGEEGSTTQIEMLDKLNQLGMLKKPGEEAEGSQTLVALQMEVKELKESMQKQEMDAVKNAVVAISNQLGEMRKAIADGGKLEGRYALLDKTIGAIENQLTGIRTDAKPLLSAIGGIGGKVPIPKSPEEKAKIARALKQAVVLEEEARKLEDELLFSTRPQG